MSNVRRRRLDEPSSRALLEQLPDRDMWIRAGIAATFVGSVITLLVMLLESGPEAAATAREPLLMLAALGAAWLLRKRRPNLGATLLLGSLWLELHIGLLEGGARAPSGSVFPVVVLGAALFVGSRVAIPLALSACASIPAVLLLRRSLGLGPFLESGDALFVIIVLLSNLTGALVLALFLRSFGKVLHHSKQNAERARALIDGAPDAILAVDVDGLIEDCNPAAERLFARPRGELVGERFDKVGLSEKHGEARSTGASLDTLTGDPREYTLGDGEITVEGLLRIVPQTNAKGGALIVLRNVTTRKLAERRAAELQAQLQHTQKLDAIGQLAGGVAHDINNLLTTVGGYGDLLAKHKDDLVRQVAEELGIARDRGSSLTRQLLAFARKESAQPRGMDLAETILGMRRLLERLAGEQIALTLDPRPGSVIFADPGQIEQVILNLAMNARDAMLRGGSLIVRCSTDERAGRVELRVIDTGVGMDEATKQRAFEPFFTTKSRGQGTGLGLASVHGIVQASGGRIRVNTEVGMGTEFVLSWPRHESVDAEQRISVAPPKSEPDSGLVLLVEDDQQSRKLIVHLLGNAGYEVVVARNADEALAAYDRLTKAGRHPDLLVSDVRMPGMTGTELATELRKAEPELPVLFISGYLGQTLEGSEFDPTLDLLRKPFSAEQLIGRISHKILRSKTDRSSGEYVRAQS